MTQSRLGRRMNNSSEATQACISYLTGGGIALTALLSDLASVAQELAIIVGCLVVFIRFVHDAINLIDRIKNGPR